VPHHAQTARPDASGRPPLALLFYDGFERQAEPTLAGRIRGRIRQDARFLVKTLRRTQVMTGFGTWFAMLTRALRHAGYDVRINDFAQARRTPRALIGVAGFPSVLGKVAHLPNPRVLGPGFYTTPLENPFLMQDRRNLIYLVGCDWQADMFRPWYGDRVMRWFGGFAEADFADASAEPKQFDVLIYDKIYFDRDRLYADTIGRFTAMLRAAGLRYAIVKYGEHHRKDYFRLIRSSRCMAFFAHSETQGMAYQECLAFNVPVFAWDEGVWPNPVGKQLGSRPVRCTSVPYFSPACGLTFTVSDMESRWAAFIGNLAAYAPRRYLATELSLEKSAAAYAAAQQRAQELFGQPRPAAIGIAVTVPASA
jgi:hypothetical protein